MARVGLIAPRQPDPQARHGGPKQKPETEGGVAQPRYASTMPDEDTTAPWAFRLVAIAAVVVVAWVLLWPVLSLARSLVAIALYVIVGVIAYQVGKVAGRASRTPDS